MKRNVFAIAIMGGVMSSPVMADFSGNVGVQWRAFSPDALYVDQVNSYPSLSAELEYFRSFNDGDTELSIKAFGRYEQNDEDRTNVDLREAKVLQYAGDFVIQAGINKVFWGAAEGFNPVNIVNQMDLAEDPGTKERLGQPMLSVAWEQEWGTINALILPGFRERTFAGESGRFRLALPIADEAAYESDDEDRHVDYAIRFSTTIGDFDVGLSHFYGTNRDPSFNVIVEDGEYRLQPYYNLIHQTGLDVQGVLGDWLVKLEVARRFAEDEPSEVSYHSVVGFEYTLVGVMDSNTDLGLIAEYYYHDKDEASANAFQNDVMIGTRWAFNDVDSTELLATAVIDQDNGSIMAVLEFKRRLAANMSLEVDMRRFVQADEQDVFYNYRKDSLLQADLFIYF